MMPPPILADDVWDLATPQHLLLLCDRLGVSGRMVAKWFRVPPSSVSMWVHGTRAVPVKHLPALLMRTRRAFALAHEMSEKARAMAPTEALRQALHDEFRALALRWEAEVRVESMNPVLVLQRTYATLGRLLAQETYHPADVEQVQRLSQILVQQMQLRLASPGALAQEAGP